MSEMESMRVVIHQQAGQIVNLIGQFRSMGEEIKKLQIDRLNDRLECNSDKEELTSYILSLSG